MERTIKVSDWAWKFIEERRSQKEKKYGRNVTQNEIIEFALSAIKGIED